MYQFHCLKRCCVVILLVDDLEATDIHVICCRHFLDLICIAYQHSLGNVSLLRRCYRFQHSTILRYRYRYLLDAALGNLR